MKHGSLFTGIGAVDLGFEMIGIETTWQCEIDEYANHVLEKRWPNVKRIRDITNWEPGPEHDVDIISGGFPCQDLSNAANNRKGLDGDRSGLWWEMLRIIGRIAPTFVLIENVPTLRHKGLWTVLMGLAELGYDAEWEIISASQFGLAHRRQRLFVIAYSNRIDWEFGGDHEPGYAVDFGSKQNAEARSCTDGGDVLRWLDKTYRDFDLSPSDPATRRIIDGLPNRVDRCKCGGNSIAVPVAKELGRRIVSAWRTSGRM